MKFKEYLLSSAQEINLLLEKTLFDWQKKTGEQYPQLELLLQEFVSLSLSGKRLRGALVKLGYELADRKYTEQILPVAVAFEVFQTAILAHDDIIDKSTLRRSKPSLYTALGGDHYGISQAISLGDLGFFLATELIAASDFPSDRKNKALLYFSRILQKTALGEMLDVFIPTQEKFSENDVLAIAQTKTAPYSITGPLSIGAILAGATDKILEQIETFGENLGIAYQIHDDILGIFSAEAVTGKSSLSDIIEGKRTLLFSYARDHGNEDQKQKLQTLYGSKVTEADADQIKEIFETTGAKKYAHDQVALYTEKAQEIIPRLTEKKAMLELLYDMTDMLFERKK